MPKELRHDTVRSVHKRTSKQQEARLLNGIQNKSATAGLTLRHVNFFRLFRNKKLFSRTYLRYFELNANVDMLT